ncbi:hypothetical protein BIW11_09087, partial [Tropilaelaps mercedesae]
MNTAREKSLAKSRVLDRTPFTSRQDMEILAERIAIELAGKIRMITTCSVCRGFLRGPSLVLACSHYICSDCALAANSKGQCPKCHTTGPIKQAEYLDKVAIKLNQIRDTLLKGNLSQDRGPLQGVSKKRKNDNILSDEDRPSPKTNKLKSTSSAKKSMGMMSSQSGPRDVSSVIFAKKSTPTTPSTPLSSPHPDGRHRIGEAATPTGVSGSVVPKKLLKQSLLSPMVETQRLSSTEPFEVMQIEDDTSTSQETDFSFTGVTTQIEQMTPAQKTILGINADIAVSQAIDKTGRPTGSVGPQKFSAEAPTRSTSSCCICHCHKNVSAEAITTTKRNSGVQVYN